jgi:hypothetical protein
MIRIVGSGSGVFYSINSTDYMDAIVAAGGVGWLLLLLSYNGQYDTFMAYGTGGGRGCVYKVLYCSALLLTISSGHSIGCLRLSMASKCRCGFSR